VTVDDESESSDLSDQAAVSDTKSARRLHINGIRPVLRRCLARWRPILLTVLLIAATGWAADLFYFDYRPDQQSDKAAAREVIRAASDGAIAVLSYSPDSLSRDIDNAKSHLTGDFQAFFKRFTEQVVAPAVQRGQITTTVHVIRAAVAELHPNSAVVLVFISQKTTSKEKLEPVKTTSSVRISLTKVKGSWLINKLDTV
jgi:Mce-associated membrane protein